MSEQFKHTPLSDSKTNIRLIQLLKPRKPAAGEKTEGPPHELNFALLETPLSTAPKYWALSYAWEYQSPSVPAGISNNSGTGPPLRSILLTRNCHAALLQLSRERSARAQPIWVDSICIDQSSVREKSHQVNLMASIYSRASRVVIWLGTGNNNNNDDDDDDDDGDAEARVRSLREMNRLALLASFSPRQAGRAYREKAELAEAKVLEGMDCPPGQSFFDLFPAVIGFGEFDPFNKVSGAAWHGRLWTLQEVVLARRAVVRVGGESLEWNRLAALADAVTAEGSVMGFTQYPGDPFTRVRVVSSLRKALPKRSLPGRYSLGEHGRSNNNNNNKKKTPETRYYRLPKGHPLGDLKGKAEGVGLAGHFIMACALGASEPRDKVYGQYAILQEHGVAVPDPDYEKPLEAICRETARAIIEYDGSLELLYYVTSPRVVPGLPSWVPDPMYDWFSWIPGSEFACAAGDSESKGRYRFGQDGSLLLKARLVGRVKRKSVSFTHSSRLLGDTVSPASIVLCYYRLQEMVRFALDSPDISGSSVEALTMVLLQEMALSARSEEAKWSALKKHVRMWGEAMMDCCNSEELYGVSQQGDYVVNLPGGETADIVIRDLPLNKTADKSPFMVPAPKSRAADGTEKAPGEAFVPIHPPTILDARGDETPIEILHRILNHFSTTPASKSLCHTSIVRFDGNSLFFTDQGLLGVANSEAIQEGDGIYLVPGMRLPAIIRKESLGPDELQSQVGYSFRACPFVHGMMKGELWEAGSEEGLEELRII